MRKEVNGARHVVGSSRPNWLRTALRVYFGIREGGRKEKTLLHCTALLLTGLYIGIVHFLMPMPPACTAALHEMCQKIILTVRQIPGTGNNF